MVALYGMSVVGWVVLFATARPGGEEGGVRGSPCADPISDVFIGEWVSGCGWGWCRFSLHGCGPCRVCFRKSSGMCVSNCAWGEGSLPSANLRRGWAGGNGTEGDLGGDGEGAGAEEEMVGGPNVG